jgi:DNA invertase Pin-like site-specific DNA recombinase
MPNSGMKVAIYCRVACADQLAIESQEHSLRVYAEEHGFYDVVVYIDNGASGIRFDRPAFIQMMESIDAGIIGTVIVRDISRISRDYIGFGKWADDMRAKGVRLISVSDLYDNTDDTAAREAFRHICRTVMSKRKKRRQR